MSHIAFRMDLNVLRTVCLVAHPPVAASNLKGLPFYKMKHLKKHVYLGCGGMLIYVYGICNVSNVSAVLVKHPYFPGIASSM